MNQFPLWALTLDFRLFQIHKNISDIWFFPGLYCTTPETNLIAYVIDTAHSFVTVVQ
jgi:hypothetical protein